MKWLFVILSMLVKRFSHASNKSNPMEEIKDFIKENSLKILFAFTSAITLGIIFASGVVWSVIALTNQYDSGLPLKFTGSVAGGFGLVLGSALVFAMALHFAIKGEKEEKREAMASHRLGHGIEEALVLLVNDFIRERELKRSERYAFEKERHNNDHHSKNNESMPNH